LVGALERTGGRFELGLGEGEDAAGCDRGAVQEPVVNGGATVDGAEDGLVAASDGVPPVVVRTPDVDEVGVVVEGCRETRAVGRVPRRFDAGQRVVDDVVAVDVHG
jgi:hypothetical protein